MDTKRSVAASRPPLSQLCQSAATALLPAFLLAWAIVHPPSRTKLVFEDGAGIGRRWTVVLAQIGVVAFLRFLFLVHTCAISPLLNSIVTPTPAFSAKDGQWAILSHAVGHPVGEALASHLVRGGCSILLVGEGCVDIGVLAKHLQGLAERVGAGAHVKVLETGEESFFDELSRHVGRIACDGGLGLVLHCCSKVTGQRGKSGLGFRSNDVDHADFFRRLICITLPQMGFRNQGTIICVTPEPCPSSAGRYPDRNDLVDCSEARIAFVRGLVASDLYARYFPLGIRCLSVLERDNDSSTTREEVLETICAALFGHPTPDSTVLALLKALGRTPEIYYRDCLFAHVCACLGQ